MRGRCLHLMRFRETPAMNILFLDQFSRVKGGQRCLLDLLPAIFQSGWNACVALPADGPFASQIKALGGSVKLIHCGLYTSIRKRPIDLLRYTWEMPLAMRGIAAMVSANNIDLLYVCGPRLILPAAVIARTQSVPLLFHCHHRIVQRSAMAVAGRALHWSNAGVIACCNFAAEPLRKYVADPVRIVYNGVPDMPYTKRPRQLTNAPG